MLEDIREELQKEEVRSISRRYFISNGFDGTLTSVGIAVGSFLSGVPSGMTVFKVAVGAAIGLATSGVWSVWEIERAEKLAELQELEKAMQTDLEGTRLHSSKQTARKINAVMSGIGPLIGILLPVLPFLFEGVITMLQATVLAVATGVVLLFSFGAYMGEISRQKWYIAGLRMGLAGLVVALLNLVLPG
ncbi:MAG: VIT1/CCC1 transporter family protein [Candidatus Nanohaloarchaea archaeon]